MIVLMVADIIFLCCSWSPWSLISYFTNWTLILDIICISLSILLHIKVIDKASEKNWLNTLAYQHFLFELTAICNTITVVAYWGFLHEFAMNLDEFKDWPNRRIHARFVHAMPAVFFLLNWIMSDVVMKARHITIFIPVTSLYLVYNYLEAMQRGVSLYPILPWHEDLSICFQTIGLLLSSVTAIYMAEAKLTQIVKRRNDPIVEKASAPPSLRIKISLN